MYVYLSKNIPNREGQCRWWVELGAEEKEPEECLLKNIVKLSQVKLANKG